MMCKKEQLEEVALNMSGVTLDKLLSWSPSILIYKMEIMLHEHFQNCGS